MAENDKKGTVLVVDDEPSIQSICKRFLDGLGFEVHTAENGEEGLSQARSKNPDFILTDIMMPGSMDGVKLFYAVKKEFPLMDVAIMTAYPTLETAIPLLKAGAYDYLIKPIDLELLKAMVVRCFEKRHLAKELGKEKILHQVVEIAYSTFKKLETSSSLPSATQISPVVTPESKPQVLSAEFGKRGVLIVSEDEQLSSSLKILLNKNGYGTGQVIGESKAVEFIEATPPQAILLDLKVARADGHLTLLKLKKNPSTAFIPVFVIAERGLYSTKTFLNISEDCEVVAYLEKPIPISILVQKLKEIIPV
ncbi:MAG: response regulator [Elusimicrobia bacterium]|nr:response regulator [Elusimicrobiota bacterium]